MFAMILAAGKGERMRPLSLHTPKPLLRAGGKPLLQYHIESLAVAGISRIVINTGRLGDMIESCFGSGSQYGVDLYYSHEGDTPLGTGGGVYRALALLGGAPFVLVNGDVWTDFDYRLLPSLTADDAHLLLVDNPAHNPGGDFACPAGRVALQGRSMYTYSGIGIYQPRLFLPVTEPEFSLVPLLKQAILRGRVSGQHHGGHWYDIGTPERLEQLDRLLEDRS